MSDHIPSPRWEALSQEAHVMEESLQGFTLTGVLDREANHLATMQEEIDFKVREALVAYWLTGDAGEIPQDMV